MRSLLTGENQIVRHRWSILLILLLLLGVLCLAVMLFFQGRFVKVGLIPIGLNSVLEADYRANPNTARVPGVRLSLIWDTILDREPNVTDLEARKAALLKSLEEPVPFITPQACRGRHVVSAAQDSWIDSANPSTIRGSDISLELSREGNRQKQVLLFFPIHNTIPTGTFINSARLELDLVATSDAGAPGRVRFFNLTTPFLESTTTWSNRSISNIQYRGLELAATQTHAWDVTDIVRDWLLERYPNHGLLIEPPAYPNFTVIYHSREAASQANRTATGPTDQLSPRLIIDCGGADSHPDVAAAVTPTPTPVSTPKPAFTNTPTPVATDTPVFIPSPTSTPTPIPPSPTSAPSTPDLPSFTPTALPAPTTLPPTPTPPSPSPPPAVANLAMSKTASPNPVIAGEQLTYTLNVVNTGPAAATGVTVIDALPAGVTLISATSTQGSGCSGAATITCNLDAIANGSSASVTILVMVEASTTGTLLNSASASSNETDPAFSDNTASNVTTVNAAADLSLIKSDAPDPVTAGNNLIYTLDVTNHAPAMLQASPSSIPCPAA